MSDFCYLSYIQISVWLHFRDQSQSLLKFEYIHGFPSSKLFKYYNLVWD